MTRGGRVAADLAGACAMVASFGAAFLVMGLVRIPLPWYHPLDRAFVLEMRPRGLAMDYYGRTLYATAVAAVAFALGRSAGRRVAALPAERAWLWTAYALAFVALAMALIGYQLWPRPPEPLPLPPWYHPY